jgi:DNA-binding transcriptional LysR family regulator
MESAEMSGLQQYIAFADTARHGGFAAAARVTGVTPSSLAKAVARLESALGVKLFHRTTRQVRLTPDGERLFQRCQRVLTEVEELEAEATGAQHTVSGVLRIDSPVYYGKTFVLPVLAKLQHTHPALRLDVQLSDRWVDLVREGVDIAVRIGALQDSTLVARRIDRQALVLCASARYLDKRGRPDRIEDLSAHDAIVFRLPTSGRERPWQLRQGGVPVELQPRPRIRVNETEALVDAVKLDFGICQLPDMVVRDELRRGEIVELLPSCRPEPLPISLVHASGRLLPARVRVALAALDGLRNRNRDAP